MMNIVICGNSHWLCGSLRYAKEGHDINGIVLDAKM